MLVFASDDARADLRRFEAASLPAFRPFDFERQARLPDGTAVIVGFTLAYTSSPGMPGIGLAVCQNRAPELLWKPDYQSHANGARTIGAVYVASDAPDRDAAFLAAMFGGGIAPAAGGFSIACGPSQEVRVVSPQTVAAIDPSFDAGTPVLAGLRVVSDAARPAIPVSQLCGMFIEWAAP